MTNGGDTSKQLRTSDEIAATYTVPLVRKTFEQIVDNGRSMLVDLLKDAYPHVKATELHAVLERDHQVYGPKLLAIIQYAKSQCDSLEIAFKVNSERAAQLETMVQDAAGREAGYKKRITKAEAQKKKLEEDGTKKAEIQRVELAELQKMGAQLAANSPAQYEELEQMKKELAALKAGHPGSAQQKALEARAQELDGREAKIAEDLDAVRKFSASLDENMRAYAAKQKKLDDDRMALDARLKDLEHNERTYREEKLQLDLDEEYVRQETAKLGEHKQNAAPVGKREEQLRVGMLQLREGVQRAQQYVLDIKKYAHDKHEEVCRERESVTDQRKAAHTLLKNMVTEGKKIVDAYLNFAVERASNQNKELGEALKTELEQARATAAGDVDKYFSGIQLSQVQDLLPPEETKRYNELVRGLDGIEKFLLSAEGSDILDLELPHDKPATTERPPAKTVNPNDTVVFTPIPETKDAPPKGND